MQNRLFRSRTDVMVGGVCGGLAVYLQVDATLVRLFFVLLGLAGGGIGLLIYMLLWIIVPLEGAKDGSLQDTVQAGSEEIAAKARAIGDDLRGMVSRPNPRAAQFVGAALMILGVFFLLQNMNLPWLKWLDFDVLWPLLLILGGIALLRRHYMK
jgi:phage shock protein C